jgi:hypothetical protein
MLEISMRALIVIALAATSSVHAQDPPKPVKTIRIQQASPDTTALYSVGSDGVVKIDWDAVETLAASKSDRALSPVAEVMIAIRDKSWKPMR